jgi:hypothetical protein
MMTPRKIVQDIFARSAYSGLANKINRLMRCLNVAKTTA